MFVLADEGKQRTWMPTQSPSHARQQLPKYISAKVWQREARVTRSALTYFSHVPLVLTYIFEHTKAHFKGPYRKTCEIIRPDFIRLSVNVEGELDID